MDEKMSTQFLFMGFYISIYIYFKGLAKRIEDILSDSNHVPQNGY